MESVVDAINQCIEYYSQFLARGGYGSEEEYQRTQGIIEGLELSLKLVKGGME